MYQNQKILCGNFLVNNMVPRHSGEKYGSKTFWWKIWCQNFLMKNTTIRGWQIWCLVRIKMGPWVLGCSFLRLSCGPNNCAESFIIHDVCDCSSQKYSVIYVNEKRLCLGCMILQSNIQWIHSPAQLSWDSYYIVTLKEIIQFDIMGSQQLKLHVQNLSPPTPWNIFLIFQ